MLHLQKRYLRNTRHRKEQRSMYVCMNVCCTYIEGIFRRQKLLSFKNWSEEGLFRRRRQQQQWYNNVVSSPSHPWEGYNNRLCLMS